LPSASLTAAAAWFAAFSAELTDESVAEMSSESWSSSGVADAVPVPFTVMDGAVAGDSCAASAGVVDMMTATQAASSAAVFFQISIRPPSMALQLNLITQRSRSEPI
jgi:hypothetical protein